ncbi:DUF3467 domain-containing protein [Candidatus Marinamargulisbacteria bacterium SCGC AAA071-K20]|nr:DUF3467 domain-containing protein [Candidatus Marinamargulisbacteria bacterium SCGC AAA071-K20]
MSENIKSEGEEQAQEQESIQVDIDEETSFGKYANLTLSFFSREEFILDFAFLQSQIKKAKIRSRVILTPKNAKRLADLLNQQIEEYEEKIGPITGEAQPPHIDLSIN